MENFYVQLASLVYILFLGVVLLWGYVSHLAFLEGQQLALLRKLCNERDQYEDKAATLIKSRDGMQEDFFKIAKGHIARIKSLESDINMFAAMRADAEREYKAALRKYNEMRG